MLDAIQSFISANLGADSVNENIEDMHLFSLGLDSLLIVGLIVELESVSGISLDDATLERLLTNDSVKVREVIDAFEKNSAA
ncbi:MULTISPECIES: acyl carrier protein [Serratia]|uniref:acyl carrier protein n=1 Tax=Serratia TaxID=613 RepID=UPI0006616116|nr:acyl carrier protein [Serratia sp. 506_PEND]